MTDFNRTYDIVIDAPVHEVFEYCRDPHHLFEGWHGLEVTDVVMTPEGVGTTARIVAKFARGLMVEQVEREYTEFVPDERIVSKAQVTVRFAGRSKEPQDAPVITWLFDSAEGGTKLTVIFLEEDLAWWENMLESASTLVMSKNVHSMLAAIKTGVEGQVSPTA